MTKYYLLIFSCFWLSFVILSAQLHKKKSLSVFLSIYFTIQTISHKTCQKDSEVTFIMVILYHHSESLCFSLIYYVGCLLLIRHNNDN